MMVALGKIGNRTIEYKNDNWVFQDNGDPVPDPPDQPMKTITKKRFKELDDAENKLLALEAAGVNNWEGYDTAMDGL